MKSMSVTILALLAMFASMNAEEHNEKLSTASGAKVKIYTTKADTYIIDGDTIRTPEEWAYTPQELEKIKKYGEEIRKRGEEIRKRGEEIRKQFEQMHLDSIFSHSFSKEWFNGEEPVDMPSSQQPLVDFNALKGESDIENFYFSGDLLRVHARKKGDFYLGGWNIRRLLPRLNGLLVLRSKKNSPVKKLSKYQTQLENSKEFETIVRHESINIYGHRTQNGRWDEVILFHRPDSKHETRIVLVQFLGRLRTDDITAYATLRSPAPKGTKTKTIGQ